jgi:RNA polymerase sigma-32 factor
MIASAVDMSSLSLFYRDVRRIERLTPDQELTLARRWHAERDLDAARELVCANLYAVAGIAREYRHFGLPEMDLIQEGTLGLMHAVKRFDPERGFRLMTYATWWVRAAIHDFILRSWSIVKLGTSKLQRRVFAGLKQARTAIAAMEGRGADEVAADLGISGEKFREAANAYLQRDVSLDADVEGHAMVASLEAPESTPEEAVIESDWERHRHARLHQSMARLDDRERQILAQRYMSDEPATLKQLAEQFGVSIERVRQLEARGLKRMRESLAA